MKKTRSMYGVMASILVMVAAMSMVGCGESPEVLDDPEQNAEAVADVAEDVAVPEGDYIELALNVFYNDADSGYTKNEAGPSIYVTEAGQYSLTFDCATDLSSDAVTRGVSSLKNLTAIYIMDMGYSKSNQSTLTAANIMYDSVVVDGTALTVTQAEPKSAFKANGVFDTNDPINAWDGSSVEEVTPVTDDHVANFTTDTTPKTITVTFTLSDMVWGE